MAQRIIVITGASGGLAQAIVKQLPKEDSLILLGRNKERLEHCYQHIDNKECLELDITNPVAIEKMVAQIYQRYGRIDVLINNAGYGAFKGFEEFSAQEIADMFQVNTLASIHFACLIGQKMAEQGQGHLINIVSMAGLIASAKSSIYSATKFALIGFSNALRLELADKGVYVTTVNPAGPIATKFFDQADPSGHYLESVGKFTLQPNQVAKRLVSIIGKNKRELNLPFSLAVTHQFYTLFPKLSDYLARKVFNYK
ncbi:TPA: SDR family NAD(P)-dependent oxidoreductase [Streptococcus pyogenes]|uniref:SDR family NAD(P)-dependent oxidoreductase n=1 Tax=Streptococcus pyogenes TaxID=1314 RepID=UPI002B38547B|nr:SDR family oxidoreductase [Streptococcus pyogenes]HEQ3710068.1 SDR family oxidoreductase [Streptococcus pyogenes]HEQ3802963.1 SDR family oxidoreductase [Streptococcus pyogenes]HEQ3851824.1 SDR family oxidoreductase [Streptococcus pyogenes]HEQ3946474.1 SDR family oxidoreductase [Streptococcus pyogenes]